MKKISIFFILLVGFLNTSCIEIIDDLLIHDDGSGILKYTINLSSSKVKVNSYLALDSLQGQRVPKIPEIKEKVATFKKHLSTQKGISNVVIEENYTDFIFKFSCSFSSPQALQTAIQASIAHMAKDQTIAESCSKWLIWDGSTLTRSIPEITSKKVKEMDKKDEDLLKQGSYTSITRFDRTIEKFDNQNAKLSKSQMALMLKVDTYSLKENENLIENRIFLSKIKN
ncbi:MAG: hypothetical protein FJX99_07965 [Bacteroidetes bacterium]|nr:hypothetical protein [Bacteroidota bacterium]